MSNANNGICEENRREYLKNIMTIEELEVFDTLYPNGFEEDDIPAYIRERGKIQIQKDIQGLMDYFTPKLAY